LSSTGGTAVPDAEQRAEARRWLAKARRDLAAARLCREAAEPLPDIAAYHCQQAAEKALKALLVLCSHPLMRTHDLEPLCDEAAMGFPVLAPELDGVRHLSSWATSAGTDVRRFPSPSCRAISSDYLRVAGCETRVKRWPKRR
jgi:hypothetical protein